MDRVASMDRARLLVVVLLVGIGPACARIMGVEDPIPRPDNTGPDGGPGHIGQGGLPCAGAGCPCAADSDCKDGLDTRCVSGRCAECTTNPDSCAVGYCLAGKPGAPPSSGLSPVNVCAPGCSSDEACAKLAGKAAPYCNLDRHQCVACTKETEATDCLNRNQICSPGGECVDKCPGGTCPKPTDTCCDGLCVDTTKDTFHCGGCGTACAAGETLCCAGKCKNPLTSVDACGLCTTDCRTTVKNAQGVTCVSARCSFTSCDPSFASCDNDPTNGCECACPAACNGGCVAGQCLINVTSAMGGSATCPPELPCKIVCDATVTSCTGTLRCAPGQPCSVHCNGDDACKDNTVDATGGAALCLECAGHNACHGTTVNKGGGTCAKACHECNGCSGSCGACADVSSCP